MKKIYAILLLSLFTQGFAMAQFSNHNYTIGSTTRMFRQYLPSGFNPSTETGIPLIIAMHGLGDNATNFSGVGFHYIADSARFIVVYPNGTPNAFGQNGWNNGTLLGSTADDITFLSRIIDSMYLNYNIDLAKVYVTGFSMGGIMTYHALCGLPSRIAAIASVAGTMSTPDISACNPGRPVPVMHMHGTADGTVPYSGSALPSLSLVKTTVDFWRTNNGCAADSVFFTQPDLAPGDGITVDHIVYNCSTEPVELWRENNADHVWLYRPLNDLNAITEIWLFFRNKVHPAPSLVSVAETGAMASPFTVSHTSQGVRISHSTAPIDEVSIHDMQGKLVLQLARTQQQTVDINLSAYPSQPLMIRVYAGGQYYKHKFLLVR